MPMPRSRRSSCSKITPCDTAITISPYCGARCGSHEEATKNTKSTKMSAAARRLMGVLAHPDDESLGTGGTLAKYAAEGVETYLVTATRGERGRFVEGAPRPSDTVVGCTREAELRAAAKELGIREVTCLGYPDGGVDCVSPEMAQAAIAERLRRIKPQVV